MKTIITCATCGHSVKMLEDDRMSFTTGLEHCEDGGHQYTLAVGIKLGVNNFDTKPVDRAS